MLTGSVGLCDRPSLGRVRVSDCFRPGRCMGEGVRCAIGKTSVFRKVNLAGRPI